MRIALSLVLILLINLSAHSQLFKQGQSSANVGDYTNPGEFEIGGIVIEGIEYLDVAAIKSLTGLRVGQKIRVPGDEITAAIRNLWQQGLFEDVSIEVESKQGKTVFLLIKLQERPRLSKFTFKGVKKSTADELREKIKLVKGKIVNENLIANTKRIVEKHFVDKGFLFTEVEINTIVDTDKANNVILEIIVTKNEKVKIEKITITGNTALTEKQIRRKLKETKQKKSIRIFKVSKYNAQKYEEDKAKLIEKYNDMGYRDARITFDSVYKFNESRVAIDIVLDEGAQYYFGDITWSGNTKYTDKALSNILGIDKGEIYNKELLDKRLTIDANGRDISSLYLDDGYLFFQVTPVEKAIYNDTIDLEIRIYEGAQATIDKIIVKGNDKTNDKVVLREIRTRPGQKFSRSDIIRTTRELAQLGYFDPEQLGVNPIPHPEDGTVDIEYNLVERPSDQIELSGGFGGGTIIGTLGLTFTNFSLRNVPKLNLWDPLPSGDGQRLTLRAQTNGYSYRSYSFSFTEPWLGGKKPNSFGVSVFDTKSSFDFRAGSVFESGSFIRITGLGLSLGRRLKFPDDYFTMVNAINFQRYIVSDAPSFIFRDGTSYNLNSRLTIARNSIDQPIYPRGGSSIAFTLEATPPYSLLNAKDYTDLPNAEKFKFIEYHKWKFDTEWYNKIVGNLVFKTQLRFGFLGYYNDQIGYSPFERFKLGGDGLSGFSSLDGLQGAEIIGLRGYASNSVAQTDLARSVGSPIYSKYTMELRYPISLNPQATIYMLAFAEGGDTWNNFGQFKPFNVKRSAGVGIRLFLPVFGLLGVDYGWRFDDIPSYVDDAKGRFAITIGQQF